MKDEMYDAMYQIEQTHWWFRGKQRIVDSLLDRYLPPSDAQRHLLDMGCGCGLMLQELSKRGNVEGMDYSDIAIEYCKKRFNGTLLQWDLNEPLDLQRRYDSILALDVLEHVANDKTAIRTIAGGLKPEGIAIITVPANPWMFSVHDVNCMHQRRYAKEELRALCEGAGLVLDYLSYYNFWLFPPIALARLLEKCTSRKSRERDIEDFENHVPGPWLNTALYSVFSSERWFATHGVHLPWGVSLLAVARKK